MNSMLDIAARIAQQHPEMAQNPVSQEWMRIIRDGDARRGETIANNLLGNYGLTKEQGIDAALRYFGL